MCLSRLPLGNWGIFKINKINNIKQQPHLPGGIKKDACPEGLGCLNNFPLAIKTARIIGLKFCGAIKPEDNKYSYLRPLSIMQTIKRELNEDGVLIEETWMCDGQIHRTDGPAFRSMDSDGNICQETWALNHRYQGTCLWTRHPNGNLETEQWFFDESEDSERLHQTKGPAYRKWNADGTLVQEEWFLYGKHQRTNGPAYSEWYPDGMLKIERWYVDHDCRRTCLWTRYPDGNLKTEQWFFGECTNELFLNALFLGNHISVYSERRDRTDGPAYSEWYPDGMLKIERWYVDHDRHRTDGPAYLYWNDDGTLAAEEWWMDGKQHRTDGPARCLWYVNGMLYNEYWYLNGKQHRIDGPACQIWGNPDGTLCSEYWYLNGDQHRIDGPACRNWNPDGTLLYEDWRMNGKQHRTDGPAYKSWLPNRTLFNEDWYVDGKKTSRRMIVLERARAKVLRSSRLLILANAVQCVSPDSLSVIGGFLK